MLADALTFVDQALSEFGIAGLSLRNLIEFLKTALKNSNAAVRTSATKTLVTVKLFAGSSVFIAVMYVPIAHPHIRCKGPPRGS